MVGFCIGLVTGCALGSLLTALVALAAMQPQEPQAPCDHGYHDWDQCPDCRH
jgi:hypothetical protein